MAESNAKKRVLLVDPNIDELKRMAALLQDEGLQVAIANGAPMACERAKSGRFDVLIAARALAAPAADAMGLLDALAIEIGRVPPYVLLVEDATDAQASGGERVLRSDARSLVARVHELAAGSSEAPDAAPMSAFAGALKQTRLADLLTMMAAEGRTGTLAINTTAGPGEIRIADGNVVDAVYFRLEGMKALCRLVGEPEGAFTFLGGTPSVVRRIHESTAKLLADAADELARAAALRESLGDTASRPLVAIDGGAFKGSDLARTILARLRAPARVAELLDEFSASDTAVLAAVAELDAAGRLRRLAGDADRVVVFSPERLHHYRAIASNARSPGFSGAPRIVFAGTAARLAVVTHVSQLLADASPPTESPPAIPIPYAIASLQLGDDVSFELIALPLVPAYAPLWPMTLAGASVVVRMNEAAGDALTHACAAVEVPIVDAQSLVGTIDEGDATQLANLIRAALDRD